MTRRLQFYVTPFCQTKNSLFSSKHNNNRHQLDAVFVISVFRGSVSCPSIMDVIGLWVPTRNLRNFPGVTFVHPGRTVPPPGVLLRKIQCVIIGTSSEDMWSPFALIVSWFCY